VQSELMDNQQCWINEEYEKLRLVTHYLYIFLAIVFTSLFYLAIFLSFRNRQGHSQGRVAPENSQIRGPGLRHKASLSSVMSTSTQSSSSPLRPSVNRQRPQSNTEQHPAFLVYPLIYALCTMPLAIGRIAAMAGVDTPPEFFCVAGALIVSNGWLDVLLWGTTRHTIVFGRLEDADALGLDTFDFKFMRTPSDRRFGNFVWVQGASNKQQTGRPDESTTRRGRRWWVPVVKGLGMGGSGVGNRSRSDPSDGWEDRDSGVSAGLPLHGPGKPYRLGRGTHETDDMWMRGDGTPLGVPCKPEGTSGADMMGMRIQMDTVVTVVEEVRSSLRSSSSSSAVKKTGEDRR
jgi:hypothetical protein